MKKFPLSKAFHLIEPGPVVLVTTFHKNKPNIMTMSWHMMMEFTPLIAECIANIECRVVDSSWVNKYNMFVLEGVKAWTDPKRKERRTFHDNGDGTFTVDGRTVNLRKRMTKWKSII